MPQTPYSELAPPPTGIVPRLAAGQRVVVTSRRGSRYEVVYLWGSQSGAVVRLADGRLGRLLRERVRWSSLDRIGAPGPALVEGDRVWLATPQGERQATFRGLEAGAFLTSKGPLKLEDLRGLALLFRAREILPGDLFQVRSLSGSDYQGECLAVREGGLLQVELTGGTEVNLRTARLDMDSLSVRVPIPIERPSV